MIIHLFSQVSYRVNIIGTSNKKLTQIQLISSLGLALVIFYKIPLCPASLGVGDVGCVCDHCEISLRRKRKLLVITLPQQGNTGIVLGICDMQLLTSGSQN